MNKYDIIYESLQEQVNTGVLALEDAELINDLAYNKYVIEAETDYEDHMDKKHAAEARVGKTLKNKKYEKDPKKADLIYKGKEEASKKNPGWSDGGGDISDKKYRVLTNAQKYMRKKAETSDNPEDLKKFKVAKKAIHNITHTPQDRDLAITTSDFNGTQYAKKGLSNKTMNVTTYGSYKDPYGEHGVQGKKVKLDKSKKYYHCSPKQGLTSLTPQLEGKANRMDLKKDDKNNPFKHTATASYFYPNKRIYITADEPAKNFGGTVYQLLKVPDYGYTNRIGYYIEPTGNIPVKDVTNQFK